MTALSVPIHESSRMNARSSRTLQRILRRHRAIVFGTVLILLWLVITAFAPLLAPYNPLEQDLLARLASPSPEHWFGADELGRDVFSRVLYGARVSLPLVLVVVAATAVLGSAIGAVAGFVGGILDEVFMRAADAVLAFPSLILAMAITAALGPSLNNAMLAIVLVLWPEYARYMRGQVLAVRELEYVNAARAVGAPEGRILLRHILPNTYPPILVKASLDVGNALLIVAGLSFIGLGAVPPTPEWGAMVSQGRQKFYQWWVAAFPALAIFSVVIGFNFLGDGLRDWLDPRLRNIVE